MLNGASCSTCNGKVCTVCIKKEKRGFIFMTERKPVYSVSSGRVISVSNTEEFGFNVMIREDAAKVYAYPHLISTTLKVGDQVQVGDVIGVKKG